MAAHCVAMGSEIVDPVFSTKIPASRTRNAGGTARDASPVFRNAIFFTDGLQRRFRRRSDGAGLRSRRFAENPGAGWPTAPFQEQQAGLKGPARCALRAALATPLVGSGLCVRTSNHLADVAGSTGAVCKQDVDRLLCGSGSRRGSSITTRSASADEPPRKADAPAHVDEALQAAINKPTKRALVGKAVAHGHLRPHASLKQLDNSIGLEGWPSGLRHRS
jgi:hypothetical protein